MSSIELTTATVEKRLSQWTLIEKRQPTSDSFGGNNR